MEAKRRVRSSGTHIARKQWQTIMRTIIRFASALFVGVVVASALVARFPQDRGSWRIDNAESAASCPITTRVAYGPNSGLGETLAPGLGAAVASAWAPGSTIQSFGTADPHATLSSGGSDVALLSTPLKGDALQNVWQWEIGAGLWAATRAQSASSRFDNSNQVRADDYINYLRASAGRMTLTNLAQLPNAAISAPLVPDWDVNLDGSTSLGDLGGVAGKWGQSSSCKGFIRADANNSGTVSLADLGVVTNKWGGSGFICAECVADNYFEGWGGDYSYNSSCTDPIDPISTILIVGNQPNPRQRVDDVLSAATLDDGENLVTTRQHFREISECREGEITQATEDSYPNWADRWHVRCAVSGMSSPYGSWAACTPHWDEITFNCGALPNHYVPRVYNHPDRPGNYPGSGFDAARDWLWYELVVNDGHTFLGWMNYGNTDVQQQCNGEETQSDGKVNLFRTN